MKCSQEYIQPCITFLSKKKRIKNNFPLSTKKGRSVMSSLSLLQKMLFLANYDSFVNLIIVAKY